MAISGRLGTQTLMLLALALMTAASWCSMPSAYAQSPVIGPTGNYLRTPTLSPYLQLLRRDGGPIPNYQQFVRPRLDLRRTLSAQSQAIQRQNRSITAINQRIPRPQTPARGTGVRSGFLQYSTFYPSLQRTRTAR